MGGTINQVLVPLSGVTGSGAFAGSNSPVFVAPILGAASATSINFGGSALSTYTTTTSWTPVFTFASPGDLSNSYTTQTGYYYKFGQLVYITWTVIVTPTYTTASGNAQLTGLPFTSGAESFSGLCADSGSLPPLKVSSTGAFYYLANSSTVLLLYMMQEGTNTSVLTAANLTSANTYSISGSMCYIASS